MPLLAEIADRVDAIALDRFRARDLRVDAKRDRSLVTEADLAIEEAARELVRARQPALGVFGEEHGEEGDPDATRLIIDPIDATANFARGIPIFATLLAIEDQGEIVASLVSAPALATRWQAVRGEGAQRGGRPLSVSEIESLAEAQCFHGSLGGYEGGRTPRGLVPLAQRTHRQRGFGDFYQHVLVCEGAGEIAIDPIVFPWDVAPLLLLAEESGGRATTLSGERTIYGGSLVTTNGRLHREVLAALADPG
jgi:histidinol-phosphatase